MNSLKKYILGLLLVGFGIGANAQPSAPNGSYSVPTTYKPEFKRERNHELIDKLQVSILNSDGKVDTDFSPSKDASINKTLSFALINKVDWFQYQIETDSSLDHRLKVNYLYGMEGLLNYFRDHWKLSASTKVNPDKLAQIIDAYIVSVSDDRKGKSIAPNIYPLTYDAGTTMLASGIFNNNAGYSSIRTDLFLKFCRLYPEKILSSLQLNWDLAVADSVIKETARRYPKQLYDYAAATDPLGRKIRSITDDDFVKLVASMARSKNGQQYFPFLDNLAQHKLTLQDIDAVMEDTVAYYKLLVRTQKDYIARAIQKDTALAAKALLDRLDYKAKSDFVNVINGLHTEKNPEVRFACLQNLNAEELYYLAVMSDGALYTSSFVKGIYPLMMKRINGRGDSLLMELRFDRYRKFIKMTAGFNMLDDFLSSFPPASKLGEEDPAHTLMRAFVKNLEKSEGLEDGADVADSYASIVESLPQVAKNILQNIQYNYSAAVKKGNKRGITIYNILNKLFLSADTTKNIDLTKELGIPPVYSVPFRDLIYDSSRVAVQLFIYGDKDGIGVFPGLVSMFNNPNWTIDGTNPQWVSISSAKGKPITLYMNKPLPEENDEDAKAQEALCAYLAANHIVPKVTINRGHSYNAPYTIEQMSTASKIVFMGSCGGYRMIHDILEKAPDAHIIGTKQIADAPVNNPFLRLLMEKLRTGSDIEWIPFWRELGKIVTDKIFEDYVPPHKNLGALFIKAYTKAINE
jgi:hypothetical protein